MAGMNADPLRTPGIPLSWQSSKWLWNIFPLSTLPDLAPLKPVRGELAAKGFPPALERAGRVACFAADEFFSARISNPETRRAYARAVGWFLEFCERDDVELHRVTPSLAGRFLRDLPVSAAAKNQALAALHHFFDVLVGRHAVLLNPFHSVRGVRHPFGEGRTPEASVKQARRLLASIKTEDIYGLRDRAVLGTLIYTGARVGAISRLRMEDLRDHGNHRALQFAEKGGKAREIPVRHDLDEWIAAYLDGADLADAPKGSPLFRAGQRRGSPLTGRAMSPLAVHQSGSEDTLSESPHPTT